jgi:hypothetical protein
MELRTYSDRTSQALHLSPALWGDTLITTCDRETQPLWLQVVITVYYPDACRTLRFGPDATLLIDLLPEMLQDLRIGPDAVRQLQDEGYASVELAIGPDANVTVELSTTAPGFAERKLVIGAQVEAHLQLLADGSAQICIEPDALAKLEAGGGSRTLRIGPDAELKIILDICGDE